MSSYPRHCYARILNAPSHPCMGTRPTGLPYHHCDCVPSHEARCLERARALQMSACCFVVGNMRTRYTFCYHVARQGEPHRATQGRSKGLAISTCTRRIHYRHQWTAGTAPTELRTNRTHATTGNAGRSTSVEVRDRRPKVHAAFPLHFTASFISAQPIRLSGCR